MKRLSLLLGLTLALTTGLRASDSAQTNDVPSVLIVVGAPGEEEFGKQFAQWAQRLQQACRTGGAHVSTIGLSSNAVSDYDSVKAFFEAEPKTGAELWLILIGHGTFDSKEAKFNLAGPDLSASELAQWLKPFSRPLAIINCASASSPFLNKLSGKNRVIVTATKSGFEQNFCRFGDYFSKAIADPAADLDKDGQTSLLEAFLSAAAATDEFYKTEGRLATEHPLLDDNGDGFGTPADFFRGVRSVKKPDGGRTIDGLRAHQFHLVRSDLERKLPHDVRVRRDDLELKAAQLRERKSELGEEAYYRQLEPMLLELARLYQSAQ